MEGDAILDFQICKISLADNVWKTTHHHANCRQNWSSVVETLQFFAFSKWPPPPSWIFEIAKFYWLLWQRGSRHISMPNFVKIGQSVAKILRFFSVFQDGGRRHFGLSNPQNFIGWQCPEGIDALFYQISSKSVVPLRRYCDFANFQNGGHRHLAFLKSWNFIGYCGREGPDTSPCQISSK